MKVSVVVNQYKSVIDYKDSLIIIMEKVKPEGLHFKPTPRKGCGRVVRTAQV